jgi:hypothetical protein
MKILFTLWLWLLFCIHIVAEWSPFVALRPLHLVALYPLTGDVRDYAPIGVPEGYGLHGKNRGARLYYDAESRITKFDRQSGIDLPFDIGASVFSDLSMGAWINIESATKQSGYTNLCVFLAND